MPNLSQIKRQRMLDFLEKLKQEHTDDESIRAFTEIENFLRGKKYGLVWEEHSERVDELLKENIPIFTEDTDRKITALPDASYNFILEGDNLQSLYLLQKTHMGKVDVIYIDPPYNTGGKNNFRYDDCIVDSNDSFQHSKWCSFMTKRLEIARNLLTNKGLIFISIDDNEYANLKLLCDSIFGEENFVTTCVWQKIHSIKNDAKYLSVNHDYVMIYAKDKDSIRINRLERTGEMNSRYKNPDDDPRGAWQSGDLVANETRTNGNYDVIGPTGKIFNVPPNKHWVYSEENMKELIADNRIWFGKNGTSFPRKKRFLSEVQTGRTPDTWWRNEEVGHNQEGARDLKKIVGIVHFNNPKPVRLISRVLKIASNPDSVVLDFFAGSGTTAQAVLELNKQDGGHRSFILCTNNENNICTEVTYPRTKTVITGIRQDGSKYSDGIPANLKYFKCDWTPRRPENYLLSNTLCLHIREMIELQQAIEIDNVHNVLILNKSDYQKYIMDDIIFPQIENVWVNQNIIFNAEEMERLNTIGFKYIPREFFGQELREVAE